MDCFGGRGIVFCTVPYVLCCSRYRTTVLMVLNWSAGVLTVHSYFNLASASTQSPLLLVPPLLFTPLPYPFSLPLYPVQLWS